MNEKLDLVEILKNCPQGTKLYLSIIGEQVSLDSVWKTEALYPIIVKGNDRTTYNLTKYGQLYISYPQSECVLFPSKEQRDWSKFKVSVKKFDYSTLKPFDRVLVRDYNRTIWRCSIFTCFYNAGMLCDEQWAQGIPYNDETKHLAGTTDMPDKKYIWWEE